MQSYGFSGPLVVAFIKSVFAIVVPRRTLVSGVPSAISLVEAVVTVLPVQSGPIVAAQAAVVPCVACVALYDVSIVRHDEDALAASPLGLYGIKAPVLRVDGRIVVVVDAMKGKSGVAKRIDDMRRKLVALQFP